MKKILPDRDRIPPEDSLERYDWSKATRGRYATRFPRGAHAVVIAPDLWPYFGTADAVNDGLQLLVEMAALARKVKPRKRIRLRKRQRAA
ncbi:MAG: hypothetical protein ACRERD_21885 [Candidatus Binatia bacterium]